LGSFGSLRGILTANDDELALFEMPPQIWKSFRALRQALRHLLLDNGIRSSVFSSSDAVVTHVFDDMVDLPRETFRVLFLDAGNYLLRDEVMWEGTVSKVQIHPREVIRLAIQCDATAMIMVHNHPSGNPAPSQTDIDITRQLCAAAATIDAVVHDHLIIGRCGWLSLRAEGHMDFLADPLLALAQRSGQVGAK
jgi:DNA repair protein RadC